jgi:peptidoglycan/xylan/chitin deacetylase (PgdA/CDA1 family)
MILDIEGLKSNPVLWDTFTRKEEYYPKFLDAYDRFRYYSSNNRKVFEPSVSNFFVKNGLSVEYPEGKKFAVCLTHDIDLINYSRASAVGDIAKSLICKQGGLFKNSIASLKNPKKFLNFKEIIELEKAYAAKSSFFIMALQKGERDYNYSPSEIEFELGSIIDSDCEIGLHGGHSAFDDLAVLKDEKNRLERVIGRQVVGYRNHFLRFKVPTTWENLQHAGFKYDSSLCFPEVVGFRNGMCHPFKPINALSNQEIDIFEFPLVIQDVILGQRYMRLDEKTAFDVCKYILDQVEINQGAVTILWHNDNLFDQGYETSYLHKKFYQKLLNYLNERKAWITSGEAIYKFWVENS